MDVFVNKHIHFVLARRIVLVICVRVKIYIMLIKHIHVLIHVVCRGWLMEIQSLGTGSFGCQLGCSLSRAQLLAVWSSDLGIRHIHQVLFLLG